MNGVHVTQHRVQWNVFDQGIFKSAFLCGLVCVCVRACMPVFVKKKCVCQYIFNWFGMWLPLGFTGNLRPQDLQTPWAWGSVGLCLHTFMDTLTLACVCPKSNMHTTLTHISRHTHAHAFHESPRKTNKQTLQSHHATALTLRRSHALSLQLFSYLSVYLSVCLCVDFYHSLSHNLSTA